MLSRGAQGQKSHRFDGSSRMLGGEVQLDAKVLEPNAPHPRVIACLAGGPAAGVDASDLSTPPSKIGRWSMRALSLGKAFHLCRCQVGIRTDDVEVETKLGTGAALVAIAKRRVVSRQRDRHGGLLDAESDADGGFADRRWCRCRRQTLARPARSLARLLPVSVTSKRHSSLLIFASALPGSALASVTPAGALSDSLVGNSSFYVIASAGLYHHLGLHRLSLGCRHLRDRHRKRFCLKPRRQCCLRPVQNGSAENHRRKAHPSSSSSERNRTLMTSSEWPSV